MEIVCVRCKRDLCDQKATMSALMDKDEVTQTSRRAIEAIVQDFYTDLFRSSIPVARSVIHPADEAPPILKSEVAYSIGRMKPRTAPGLDGISADALILVRKCQMNSGHYEIIT
ncbi:hypothetical protein Q1695_003464 [Nippostrongylus brasiliensis]|nr:hypothetical protein Q1695_003464 [Nippostrongylus brasiliensis]